MTSEISIEKEISGKTGRYVARIDGIAGEAYIAFTILGPALIGANHTFSPETMRGTGAALALVEYMVADARATGVKIAPVCPYILAQYKKHPEWRDAMTVEP